MGREIPGPDWATLPLWTKILIGCRSRTVSKTHQEGRPEVESQQLIMCVCVCRGGGTVRRERGTGAWADLPGPQPRWQKGWLFLALQPRCCQGNRAGRLWLFSLTVGTERYSQTHTEQRVKLGFIQNFFFPFGCTVWGSGGGEAAPLTSKDVTDCRPCLCDFWAARMTLSSTGMVTRAQPSARAHTERPIRCLVGPVLSRN